MKLYAALSQKDVKLMVQISKSLKDVLDDPKEFERRMQTNPTFADLYQNDPRVQRRTH